MKRELKLVLLSALLFTAIAARAEDDVDVDFDEEDPAFLAVRKAFADDSPAAIGRARTVVVEVKNEGESTAFDIQIDDGAALPEGVALAPGQQQTSATFKKLGGGETAKFSYDVVPSVGGRALHLPRASVAYTVSEGEGKRAKREGRSTSAAVYVETPVQLALRHALNAGSYATLGVLRTPEQWRSVGLIAAFLGLVFGGSSVFGKTKEAAAASRRSKALAELENEKTK